MSSETLNQVYQLITQGNKEEAINLLTPLLKADRDNKNAWWLLANAASKPEQIEFALKNVLRIDPHHAQAQTKLDQLHAQSAADFFSTVSQDEPDVVDAATLSYFGTPEVDAQPDFSDWGNVDSKELVAYSPTSSISPRSTASLPPFPTLEPRKQRDSGLSANFVFAAAALLMVGVCAIFFILYSAGVLDGILGVLPPAAEPKRGWQTYSGNGMSIQLPDEWEDIDIASNSGEILDIAASEFPEVASQIELMRSEPDLFRFMAIDSSYPVNNVVVTSETIGIFMTLDSFLEISEDQFPSQYNVVSQTTRQIEPFGEVGVIEANVEIYGVSIRQILYVIKRRNRVWGIAFTTESGLYNDYLEDFEYSLSTFRPD